MQLRELFVLKSAVLSAALLLGTTAAQAQEQADGASELPVDGASESAAIADTASDTAAIAEDDDVTTNDSGEIDLSNDPLLAAAMAMDSAEGGYGDNSYGDSDVSSEMSSFASKVDKLEINFSGRIQSDIRFRPVDIVASDAFYNRKVAKAGVERNQNLLNAKLDIHYGRATMVADLDFVFTTLNTGVEMMPDLWDRAKVDPYYLRANALYIDAKNIFTKGLDFRIGQQLAQFGMADQFNPTNTINANDIEDPLLFGTQIANMMIRADYALPEFKHFENWTITGLLVPFFKPAMLPNTAIFGTTNIARMPFIDETVRYRMHSQAALASALNYKMVVDDVVVDYPDTSFDNMQWFFRMGWSIHGHDMAISYYNGRFDTPTPSANISTEYSDAVCDPTNPADCVHLIKTETHLAYPKVQVLGFNFAGEIPLNWMKSTLKPLGYRFELAVFFPHEQGLKLTQNNITMGMPTVGPFGEILAEYNGDYPLYGASDLALDNTPFAKWTLGIDYTFGVNTLVMLMWVHGFVDEYGAGDFFHEGYTIRDAELTNNQVELTDCFLGNDGSKCVNKEVIRNRLGDYLVLGANIDFLEKRGQLRLFFIWEMTGYKFNTYNPETKQREIKVYGPATKEGFSMVIYPEISYNFGHGFEWAIGGLIKLGRDYTKFGEAAAGGSSIFTRARFSF